MPLHRKENNLKPRVAEKYLCKLRLARSCLPAPPHITAVTVAAALSYRQPGQELQIALGVNDCPLAESVPIIPSAAASATAPAPPIAGSEAAAAAAGAAGAAVSEEAISGFLTVTGASRAGTLSTIAWCCYGLFPYNR